MIDLTRYRTDKHIKKREEIVMDYNQLNESEDEKSRLLLQ